MENANQNTQAETVQTVAKEMNIYQKLGMIQTNLKAPKNMYNSYGKYNYRNAEGILESLKPHLLKYKVIVIIEDCIEHIGEITAQGENGFIKKTPNCYIKATVRFIDTESGQEISTNAYAHECEHKGMSADQCTGTASSYARKYALNALFLLDDTKDSDTNEMHRIENSVQSNQGNNQQNGGNGWRNQQPQNRGTWNGQQNNSQRQQNGGWNNGQPQQTNNRRW